MTEWRVEVEIDGSEQFKAQVRAALALLDATGDGAWVRARIARIRPARPGELGRGQAGRMDDSTSTIIFDEQYVVAGVGDLARGGASGSGESGRAAERSGG